MLRNSNQAIYDQRFISMGIDAGSCIDKHKYKTICSLLVTIKCGKVHNANHTMAVANQFHILCRISLLCKVSMDRCKHRSHKHISLQKLLQYLLSSHQHCLRQQQFCNIKSFSCPNGMINCVYTTRFYFRLD